MREDILDTIKDLTRMYGRVYFDISLISEESGLSVEELFYWLKQLNDDCCIILDGDSVCLDSDTLC